MLRSRNAFGLCLVLTSACVGNISEPEYRLGAGPSLELNEAGIPEAGPLDASVIIVDGQQVFVPPTSSDASTLPTATDGSIVATPADASVSTPVTPENPCGGEPAPVVGDLRIKELALYQAVKVPLYANSAWVATRKASVVQGKKGLLRVFVEPTGSFAARTLRAVLTLSNGGVAKTVTVDRAIQQASTDATADSTFDFPLEGTSLAGDTELSVSLIETKCPATRATPAVGARLPESGTRALNASRIGKLRVVMVPVNIGGSVPDTSPTQLAKIRENLLAYYPVPDVEVTAHEPITWTRAISANGTGWDTLLDQIGTERAADTSRANAPVGRDVYYFGLIVPKPTFNDYCASSCVLGLAPLALSASPNERIGLGVGYVNNSTYTTVVHELGHAHGISHAPCVPNGGAIDGVDTSYANQGAGYVGGKIGSWGWDSRSNKLMAPTAYTDIMGYCNPTWISDYNYEKLATRARSVNTAAYVASSDKAASTVWRRLILSPDGSLQWSALRTRETPGGLSWARALDDQGNELAELQVAVVALSHSDSKFIYVPELADDVAALDIGGQRIDLRLAEPSE